MTKKELKQDIKDLEREVEYLDERLDNYNKFNLDLLKYLGLDFDKKRVVKEEGFFDEEEIVTEYIFKKSKTKKNK